MTELDETTAKTPWQKVFSRFGALNQSAFAKAIEVDRSKVSRALSDDEGLINGRDQRRILDAAARLGVEVMPTDFLPDA